MLPTMLDKLNLEGTVASRVTDKLREDIITHKIEAGSRITIKEIADSYGVGSMPVREAFRTLEGEHLIVMLPYKGATVAKIDKAFASDIYQISCYLEMLISLNALEHITEEACDQLQQLNGQMKALIGKDEAARAEYTGLNWAFHDLIGAFNPNKRVNELFAQQQDIIRAIRKVYIHSDSRILCATQQHDAIIEAMRTKNRALLREITEQHSDSAMQDFIQQYSNCL